MGTIINYLMMHCSPYFILLIGTTSCNMVCLCVSACLAADLHFQFGDSALQAKELLLEGGLFSLEGGDLLLDAAVFGLLEVEVALPA